MNEFDWSDLFDDAGHATAIFRNNIRGFIDAWRCGDGCRPFHQSLQVLKTLNDMHDLAAGRNCCTLSRACFDRLKTQVDLSGIKYKCDEFGHAIEEVYLATQDACRKRSAEISRDGLPTGATLASQMHSWPSYPPSQTNFLAFVGRYRVAPRYLNVLIGRDDWRDLARIEIRGAPVKAVWLDNIKKKIDAKMAMEVTAKRFSKPSYKTKPKECTSRPFTAEELKEERRLLHATAVELSKKRAAAKKTRAYSFFGELLNG